MNHFHSFKFCSKKRISEGVPKCNLFGIQFQILPQGILLESPWLMFVDIGAFFIAFRYPLGGLLVSFCYFFGSSLDSPWFLAFHYEYFFHLSELTLLPTEKFTDAQPIGISMYPQPAVPPTRRSQSGLAELAKCKLFIYLCMSLCTCVLVLGVVCVVCGCVGVGWRVLG